MKKKYVGMIMVGILAVGSYSVLAREVKPTTAINTIAVESANTNLNQVSSAPLDQVENKTYDKIKSMIDKEIANGNLTEKEAEEMLSYCIERMTNTNNGRRGFGCH